ncbi:unnamed protein product [Pieris macdunnoughi]|uniref:Uncharacterized protein n=1 Tax=Pieris macdunnoughi TaxID=345717 RepID=A0A821MG41_9NEOP|nr:unnamed protein product [Pieris macdunnoughi]
MGLPNKSRKERRSFFARSNLGALAHLVSVPAQKRVIFRPVFKATTTSRLPKQSPCLAGDALAVVAGTIRIPAELHSPKHPELNCQSSSGSRQDSIPKIKK